MKKELQSIETNIAYPLSVFQERTGLGRAAMRQARRAGMPVKRFGGRSFVLGSDWINFLTSLESSAGQGNSSTLSVI